MNLLEIPHIGFIAAAYAVTAVAVGGAVVAVALDRRAIGRALAKLEARANRAGSGR